MLTRAAEMHPISSRLNCVGFSRACATMALAVLSPVILTYLFRFIFF
jgi:hypothetical protein